MPIDCMYFFKELRGNNDRFIGRLRSAVNIYYLLFKAQFCNVRDFIAVTTIIVLL